MAINKINYGNETLIDLTEDTVTADTLAEGVTAHNAQGERITGVKSANIVTADVVYDNEVYSLSNISHTFGEIYTESFTNGKQVTLCVCYGDSKTYVPLVQISSSTALFGATVIIDGQNAHLGVEISVSNSATFLSNGDYISLFFPVISEPEPEPEPEPSSYTNIIPESTDENGDIYNGCGYQVGITLEEGMDTDDTNASAVTGYITCSSTDVIRFTSTSDTLGNGTSFAIYDDTYSFIVAVNDGDSGYSELDNIFTLNLAEVTDAADFDTVYVRCVARSDSGITGDALVATINEEI